MEPGLKPGMSATAEVVVRQEEGVNVATSAISGGAVTVLENGKHVRRRVVTGLAGNSSTIILSGLNAGEKVALPVALPASGASGVRGIGGLGRGLGGGLGGGGLGGAPGIFLRGGGG
jgi:multidrug efflux pump subunit AcrA (membrane-fusion protein)